MIHSAQKFSEQISYNSQNFQKHNLIFRFFRFQTQENRFWGLGTFLAAFYVQYFTELFTILTIFYKFSPMFHKSFSYEPSRQYGISPFSKQFQKIEIFVKGVSGKSGFFLIELPIELPIVLPIGWPIVLPSACYSWSQ